MIREAAMMTWEYEHPLVLMSFLPADGELPNEEPQWDNNDAVH
jgi:hypothetical protein